MTPIILLSGQAGSGKDTIASFLVKNHGAMAIALADPMKRFIRDTFGFSESQLWGPSSARNELVDGYGRQSRRDEIMSKIEKSGPVFIAGVQPHQSSRWAQRWLEKWARDLLESTESSGGRLSARKTLQTFGTEWGRRVSRDIWIDYAVRMSRLLLGGGFAYSATEGIYDDETKMGPNMVVITDGRFRNEVAEVLILGGHVWKIESPDLDSSAVEAVGVAGHKSESEQKSIPDHFFTATIVNDKSKGLAYAEKLTNSAVAMEILTATCLPSASYR
jgi:hypothetical protein